MGTKREETLHSKTSSHNAELIQQLLLHSTQQTTLQHTTFEDQEAVIEQINKGRSPTMKHISRTHGVNLDNDQHQVRDIRRRTLDTNSDTLQSDVTQQFHSQCCGPNMCSFSFPFRSVKTKRNFS